jgi:hypothetical protein
MKKLLVFACLISITLHGYSQHFLKWDSTQIPAFRGYNSQASSFINSSGKVFRSLDKTYFATVIIPPTSCKSFISNYQPTSIPDTIPIPRSQFVFSSLYYYSKGFQMYNSAFVGFAFYAKNRWVTLTNSIGSYRNKRVPLVFASQGRTLQNDTLLISCFKSQFGAFRGDSLRYFTKIFISPDTVVVDTFITSAQIPSFYKYRYRFQPGLPEIYRTIFDKTLDGKYCSSIDTYPLLIYGNGLRRPHTREVRFKLGADTVLLPMNMIRTKNFYWVFAIDSLIRPGRTYRSQYWLKVNPDFTFKKVLIPTYLDQQPLRFFLGSSNNQIDPFCDEDGNLWTVNLSTPNVSYYFINKKTLSVKSIIPKIDTITSPIDGITRGPDGNKWFSGYYYNGRSISYPSIWCMRDIDPRPRSFYDSLGRTRPGTRGRDTLFATSAIPNIRLHDSSTSITLGVERVRWVFPAGSGIRAGDTAVGRSVNIAVPRPGRYRIRVRVWDTTQAYSDTSFYITVRGQVQAIDESLFAGTPLIAQPNPTTGQLTITGLAPGIPITLYSASGKLLWQKEPPASTQPQSQAQSQPQPNPSEINLTAYRPGLYLLRQGQRTVRVVRE